MHNLKISTFITSLLACACGGSDAGTATDGDATTDSTVATTPPATSTAGGTTSDEAPTTGAATTHTHDSDHHGESTEHDAATTSDDHGTEGHATEGHATEGHATEDHGTTDGGSLAEQYCNCMLDSCHDEYHALWGEDHAQSEAMCMAAAAAVPSVGEPAMSGDSIECRIHFCTLGHDVAGACDSALGADPCAD